MHLSEDFGMTVDEIENDGFKVDFKVETLDKNVSAVGIAGAMSRGLSGVANALDNLKPDLVLVLGDRYEIFVSVAAALVAKIPVAHIHGGELTIGAYDDAFRHAITKMSHLHFVATEEYKNRVIQLGESPSSVYLVGGLGVDSINNLKLLSKSELEKELNLSFNEKSLLITFHPETLAKSSPANQMQELLSALKDQEKTTFIFTMPNADTGGQEISNMIKDFIAENPNAHAFTTLGQLKYFSCIKVVDAVVGNSSSGLLEVPTFKKAAINIGDRQKGRLQAKSIINCDPDKKSILDSLDRIHSVAFKDSLKTTINPYGVGGGSAKIVEIIREISLEQIVNKIFYDLEFEYDNS
jgi:GDP/UDP-N,N'-diacetylbacillosamine 2-epimerase (hydrolysing)